MTSERSNITRRNTTTYHRAYKRPMFQRRHYEVIANVIRDIDDPMIKSKVVNAFSNILKDDNENFDVIRFHDAVFKE